jgi:hypothetical protein
VHDGGYELLARLDDQPITARAPLLGERVELLEKLVCHVNARIGHSMLSQDPAMRDLAHRVPQGWYNIICQRMSLSKIELAPSPRAVS